LCDMCICVLYLIVVSLPPGKNSFAVQINNNNSNLLTVGGEAVSLTRRNLAKTFYIYAKIYGWGLLFLISYRIRWLKRWLLLILFVR
jgi:hypothetical protein